MWPGAKTFSQGPHVGVGSTRPPRRTGSPSCPCVDTVEPRAAWVGADILEQTKNLLVYTQELETGSGLPLGTVAFPRLGRCFVTLLIVSLKIRKNKNKQTKNPFLYRRIFFMWPLVKRGENHCKEPGSPAPGVWMGQTERNNFPGCGALCMKRPLQKAGTTFLSWQSGWAVMSTVSGMGSTRHEQPTFSFLFGLS